MSNEPQRMCSFCRTYKDKGNLFRIVLENGSTPYIDYTYKAQGRGAYLCKKQECIDGAKKKHSLDRSLSHKVNENIYDEMSENIDKQ